MMCIRFQELGLEKGWGDTAKRVLDTLHLLLDLLEAPDPANLEKFLGTIPMMFNVVILSPHGYFAQSNVLGYPDTGGQVQKLNDYFPFNKDRSGFLVSDLQWHCFSGCLHFGPSPCFGERNASQD
jgi:hypothetical protein